jgi:hypothetical protein
MAMQGRRPVTVAQAAAPKVGLSFSMSISRSALHNDERYDAKAAFLMYDSPDLRKPDRRRR